jgi:tRNA-dihydrouridine synthase
MDRLVDLKGEKVAVKEMRKHMAWYLKGIKGSARLKDVVMEQVARDEMARILNDFVAEIGRETESAIR